MSYFENALQIVTEKIGSWTNDFISMLPNFVIAALVVIIFYLIAKLFTRLLKSTLSKFTSNVAVIKLIASFSRIAIMAAALFIAVGILGLEKTAISLLAGGGGWCKQKVETGK